jgi:uncharacterized protein (TIGR02391 family)
MLVTDAQLDELLDTMIELSGLDPELAEICGPLIRSGQYDEAVSRAFVLLEERLRELLRVSSGAGRRLVQKLFSKDAQYIDRLRLPANEADGMRSIFDGSFAAFRNRAAHTMVGYTLDEARGIIHLVSLLLLLLEQMEQPLPPVIPAEIAEKLGPAATERLQRFLGRLEAMGVGKGRGKALTPYRAVLRYQSEGWDRPKPHSVTIFYLALERGQRPALLFNTPYLAKVPGLDRQELEGALLDSGCVRAGTKLRPIWLYLDAHNDEETFDRIYEIVRRLMEKHRA